ncbi:hypothetical protein TNCV_3141771 [Trichonephila clavipes]|nr:hypothetical protein TNCV_3141771 [Trichonephila clavipes]
MNITEAVSVRIECGLTSHSEAKLVLLTVNLATVNQGQKSEDKDDSCVNLNSAFQPPLHVYAKMSRDRFKRTSVLLHGET